MFFMKIFFNDLNENVNLHLAYIPLSDKGNIIFEMNISY